MHINNHGHAAQIARASGYSFNYDTDQCISRTENKRLLGGVIYTDYLGYSIAMHMASFDPRCINRSFLWLVYHYPFEQLGVENIFGVIKDSNKKALELCRKMGFNEVTRLSGFYKDEQLVFLRMNRNACRWLGVSHGALEIDNGAVQTRPTQAA